MVGLREFDECVACSLIRFILTLDNVSTSPSFSHLLSERRDYENSHAAGLTVPVCGPYHAQGRQAAKCTNLGRTFIVDRNRMGAGLSLSGSPQPDLQGVADARPTLRIPHIHRGAASTINAGKYLDIPQGGQNGHRSHPPSPRAPRRAAPRAGRSKRRGEAYAVRYVELRSDARTKMVAISTSC